MVVSFSFRNFDLSGNFCAGNYFYGIFPHPGLWKFGKIISSNFFRYNKSFLIFLSLQKMSPSKFEGIYAIKVRLYAVPNNQNGCSSMLITGDLSHRVVDELATLVDNIFSPLLSKQENHKDLPEVAVEDINSHVYSLRGTLYQVNHSSSFRGIRKYK